MAEELALEERLREARAVHGLERTPGAPGRPVDGARHHLLPRAAAAGDEDGHLRHRHGPDALEHLLHRRRSADEEGPRVGLRRRTRGLQGRGPRGQGPVRRRAHLAQVHGFRQVVEGASPHGVHGHVQGPVGRDHHDRGGRGRGPEPLEGVEARHAGEPHVQEHQVRRVLGGGGQGLLGPREGAAGVPPPLEEALQRPADPRLVVDDEDAGRPPARRIPSGGRLHPRTSIRRPPNLRVHPSPRPRRRGRGPRRGTPSPRTRSGRRRSRRGPRRCAA